MKTFVACSTAILSTAILAEYASAMQAYLAYIPNGSLFSQELGHPDSDSSQYTDFATAFEAVGLSWTATFCADTFPGSTMTNGAAFGDPCCTWSQGDTPDFTVTVFTTDPTTATVCASSSVTSSTVSSSVASTTSSATSSGSSSTDTTATTDAPSATTDAPTTTSTTSSSTTDTSTTDAPATTNAPSTGDSMTTGGCRAKEYTGTTTKTGLRA